MITVYANTPAFSSIWACCKIVPLTLPPPSSHTLHIFHGLMSWFNQRNLSRSDTGPSGWKLEEPLGDFSCFLASLFVFWWWWKHWSKSPSVLPSVQPSPPPTAELHWICVVNEKQTSVSVCVCSPLRFWNNLVSAYPIVTCLPSDSVIHSVQTKLFLSLFGITAFVLWVNHLL